MQRSHHVKKCDLQDKEREETALYKPKFFDFHIRSHKYAEDLIDIQLKSKTPLDLHKS